MQLYRLALAALALILAFCLPSAAQAPQAAAQPWTQVGSLVCKVDPNVGFIFGGHQPMQCTYTPSLAPAPPEYYDGAINTVGIDIGVSAGSVLFQVENPGVAKPSHVSNSVTGLVLD